MKKDNVKKPTKKTDEVSSAQTWKERYTIAVNNQETMFKKFSDWYKLMYATVDDSNIALWRSKIFIPVLAGKAWNLISKFVNLKPGFQVALRNPDASDEAVKEMADKMQLKLEYDYDNPNMDESIRDKMLSCLIDAVVTGTGIAKVPWHVKTKKQYERIIGDDGTVDLSKQKVTESKYGCNDLVPVNIYNVFIAPGASFSEVSICFRICLLRWRTQIELTCFFAPYRPYCAMFSTRLIICSYCVNSGFSSPSMTLKNH